MELEPIRVEVEEIAEVGDREESIQWGLRRLKMKASSAAQCLRFPTSSGRLRGQVAFGH